MLGIENVQRVRKLGNCFQFSQNLIRRSHVGNRATHLAKHLCSILIKDERRSQRDVLVLVPLGMEQALFAFDFRSRIAQNDEVTMGSILPDFARVVQIIHADRHYARVLRVEVWFSLRELAQLLHTEGSPIAAIKVQNNFVPALLRQPEGSSSGIG